MREIDPLLEALKRSRFRRRFALGPADRAYLADCTRDRLAAHARRFVVERLAAAQPANDGRQTPMRGHPVFIAQHATATCCRRCLSRWHHIPRQRPLSEREVDHVVAVILRWLDERGGAGASLFD